MFRSILVAPVLSWVVFLSVDLAAQTLSKRLVHSGLVRPVFVTAPAGDTDRLFIVEQGNTSSRIARIRISKNGSLLPTPFLDIDNLVANSGNERGLLGLAFHPDYSNNGYFYVNYTATNGSTVIRRFEASPSDSDVVSPATGVTLMTIGQPFGNHNGGMMAFGRDGYLYIGMGDGGSGLDPQNNAQNLNSLLGKMLRIDVDNPAPGQNYGIPPSNPLVGKAGRDEIYHWGLRNPWRWSFDRATGDMYIGDVGQGAREEIDYVPAGTDGLNFGWRCLEGTRCTGLAGCVCTSPSFTAPAHWYSHGVNTGASINGGYVYRGCAIPSLTGTYFFSDYITGECWSANLDPATGRLTGIIDRTSTLGAGVSGFASFGEDAHGEIYIIGRNSGTLHRIVGSELPTGLLAYGSGVPGSGDIAPKIGSGGESPEVASSTFKVEVTDVVGGAVCAIAGSFERAETRVNGGTLYGDFLTPGNFFVWGFTASGIPGVPGVGTATLPVPIPNDPSLVGFETYWQGFVVDGGSPLAIGIAHTCGLAVTVY